MKQFVKANTKPAIKISMSTSDPKNFCWPNLSHWIPSNFHHQAIWSWLDVAVVAPQSYAMRNLK